MEAAPHPWPAIGSLMLRDGYVTREQLEEILRAQHDAPERRLSGWRLGEIVVDRGLMTQGQVAQLVAEQYELPYLELDADMVDRTVVDLLPAEMTDRFAALPVEIGADGSLVVAVADPGAALFSDELRRALGRPLRFAVVARDAMEAAVAALRGEEPTEPTSLSLAAWPSGTPSFGFPVEQGEAPPASSYPPLGTLLVRDGIVTEEELDAALAEQRLSGEKRLGEILVERGTLTRADVARMVAEQYELEFIDLAELEVDPRVAALLPFDIALRYGALPLDFLPDGSLRVAVADPTKVLAPEEILAALGARLTFAVADPDLVEAALERQRGHADAGAESWASLTPVGPPLTGSHERPHVDASDLIIVPSEEVAPAELPTLELAPEADGASVSGDEPGSTAAAEVETRPSEKKRKRSWFRRKQEHEEGVPTRSEPESSLHEAHDEASSSDPLAGLLLAGEAADGEDTPAGDPSPRATEQAAVLRLWIAGDGAATSTTEEERLDEVAEPELPDEPAEPAASTQLDVVTAAFADAVTADEWNIFAPSDPVPSPTWSATSVSEAADDGDRSPALVEADSREAPLVDGEAHTLATDAWLAELEPDSPEDTPSPWELEDVPVSSIAPALDDEHCVEPSVSAAEGALAPLVERAVALGATTLHFSAQEHGIVVRARIDGVLRKLATVAGQARFELARELGLAAQGGTLAGGHVTSLPTAHGETVTVRFRTTSDAPTLESLTLEATDREAIERALRQPFGLVLVAGPSGAGRADTLSAALRELASAERAVMTIEDPVLRVVPGADQVAVDHTAGRGYADGLRSLLAADPDALLVGELADEETARLAVDAATGHLVVTAVLAQSAVGAVDRLSLLGVDADLVAATLSLVVCQRLVRRLCDHCREGYYATAADAAALQRPDEEIGRRLLARGTGCSECGDTGFAGTIGAYEVLTPNDEVRALIAANAPAADVERAARLAGKRTLADDAVRLVLEGLTTVAEIRRVLGRALY